MAPPPPVQWADNKTDADLPLNATYTLDAEGRPVETGPFEKEAHAHVWALIRLMHQAGHRGFDGVFRTGARMNGQPKGSETAWSWRLVMVGQPETNKETGR